MKLFLSDSRSLAAKTKIFWIPSQQLNCSAECLLDAAWLQPMFEGCLRAQQIKSQWRVESAYCYSGQLAVIGVLPTNTCSMPSNLDVYPTCSSEFTTLPTGK